jgi:hypothetical protein
MHTAVQGFLRPCSWIRIKSGMTASRLVAVNVLDLFSYPCDTGGLPESEAIGRRRRESGIRGLPRSRRPARSHPGTFELASPKSRAAMSLPRALEAASEAERRRPGLKGVRGGGSKLRLKSFFPNRGASDPGRSDAPEAVYFRPTAASLPEREAKAGSHSARGTGRSGTRRLFLNGRLDAFDQRRKQTKKVVQPRMPVARTRRPQFPPSGNGGTTAPPRHPGDAGTSAREVSAGLPEIPAFAGMTVGAPKPVPLD